MPIMFADLVPSEIDRNTLMLVRHHSPHYKRGNTPFDLWRTQRELFEIYQRCQGKPVFRYAANVASFVVSPEGETIFIGVYANAGLLPPPADLIVPIIDWRINDDPDACYYDLSLRDYMSEYVGKLAIEWGMAALAWVQYAKNEKVVTRLSKQYIEEPFPGYSNFIRLLSEIDRLPAAWTSRLQEARGIYVLSCPTTNELYVGSATSEGGFIDRWRQHAKAGGDAKMLRSREASDYQVAIVEVAGSSATRQDILHAEQLWMRKLRTTEMGLNGGMLRDGREKPDIV